MWIEEAVQKAERILILGHVRPDGDCVGSTLGLCHYLRETGPSRQVKVCLEPFSPDFFLLKGAEEIVHELREDEEFELCIAVDVSDPSRLGAFATAFDRAERTLCIDHHVTNAGFAEVNRIEAEASSSSELMFTLLDPEKLSLQAAECLYLGIVHDTGVFKHSCTRRQTMEVAGALLEKGVRPNVIIDGTFYHKTFVQNRILGQALLNASLALEGECIFSALTAAEMAGVGAASLDLEGIIDQLRVTAGTSCAVFMHENADGSWKVSLRGGMKVDVSRIAASFGGGGHVKAAGCTLQGSAQEVRERLLEAVERQLAEEAS